MKNRNRKKTISLVICALIILCMLINFGIRKLYAVETQQANFSTVKDEIETFGWVVRDEIVLNNSDIDTNNIKYLFGDGEKIAKNDILAQIYSNSEEAKIGYKIDEVSKEIEVLEKLNLSKYNLSKGINFINGEINEEIKNLLVSLGDSKISEYTKNKRNILYLLNEKQIILGKDIDLEERLKNLRAEKNNLLSHARKSVDVIKSPESGDFITHTDGYENFIDYKNIASLNFNNFDFNNDVNSDNLKNNNFGKIIKSETWYAICSLNSEDAARITNGQDAKLNISSSNFAVNIPCKIESITKKSDSDDFWLVISCDYMNKEIALLRKENFKINLGEYSGLKINKNAIHKYSNEGGNFESGVYIKSGGYLKFKKINPIFAKFNEVVCSYNAQEAADEKYLQPGDFVVIGGTDLYENKKLM